MEAYTGFASVYDMFMDNVPYEQWFAYVKEQLITYGIEDGLLLDLGCGTGVMTRMFAKTGYDMIGIDLSGEMLQIAIEQSEEKNPVLYLEQDMREFELYGTVRGVISLCDSINYILEYDELVQVFRLVNNYLDPNGIFVFDFNTKYKYKEIMGEETIAENREDGSFIWENYYDEETDINEFVLTLFIRESDGRFERREEVHYQAGWTLDIMKMAIEEAGLEFIEAVDEESKEEPTPTSERIYIIARERGKEV